MIVKLDRQEYMSNVSEMAYISFFFFFASFHTKNGITNLPWSIYSYSQIQHIWFNLQNKEHIKKGRQTNVTLTLEVSDHTAYYK